ncbi:claspin-like [Panonychus citri]|uniref:claspin-like n=1 Tax=Panonychus citri TaxID=50023 RepID=UPI002307CFF8|nr:claspin-like [Panonychus citri]
MSRVGPTFIHSKASSLLENQRLTYIVNDNIQLRPDRLERLNLVSGVTVNGSNGDVKAEVKTEKKEKEKEKENKTETKKETKSSKRTTNRRGNGNKKQSKLSGFGSKIPKSEKTNSSGDSGFSMESTPDPFSEEEEEEKSPVSVKEEEMEFDPSPVSPPSSSEEKIPSEDEKPRGKEDDSEDEAIFMEEVKRKSKKEKSKKRKRVRIYDSDEGEDEKAMALRILAGEDGDNSKHSSVARSSIESNKTEEPEIEQVEMIDGDDSDDEEIVKPRDFFFNEAEVSGSDSSDEEEEEDEMLKELIDEKADALDYENLRKDVAASYQKELLRDDKRLLLQLQEKYLEGGDVHYDQKRVKRFKWKTAASTWLDDARDSSSDDENSGDEDGEYEAKCVPVFKLKNTITNATNSNIDSKINLTLSSLPTKINQQVENSTRFSPSRQETCGYFINKIECGCKRIEIKKN